MKDLDKKTIQEFNLSAIKRIYDIESWQYQYTKHNIENFGGN